MKISNKIKKEEIRSFEEIISDMELADTYEDLRDAASYIEDISLKNDVYELIDTCENDGDDVETAYSIITSDLLDSRINDLNEHKKISESVEIEVNQGDIISDEIVEENVNLTESTEDIDEIADSIFSKLENNYKGSEITVELIWKTIDKEVEESKKEQVFKSILSDWEWYDEDEHQNWKKIMKDQYNINIDNLNEKKSKGRKIEFIAEDAYSSENEELLTEGGIYPVSLETADAITALELKLEDLLGNGKKVQISVRDLELIPAKGWVDNNYWYKAIINVGDIDILENFMGQDTPILNKLKEDNLLQYNPYSDITVDANGYDSGISVDWYMDSALEEGDPSVAEVDAEADKVGEKIIRVLKEHEEEIINLLKEYEIADDEDLDESKDLKESIPTLDGDPLYIDFIAENVEDKTILMREIINQLSNEINEIKQTDLEEITVQEYLDNASAKSLGYLDESKELDEKSFNSALTKFIKENYKNAVNLRVSKVVENKEGLSLECRLKLKGKPSIPVTLEAKGNINEKRSILKVYENKIIKHEDKDKNIMTMIISNTNRLLKLEKLKYNFNTKLTEGKRANVSGIIK